MVNKSEYVVKVEGETLSLERVNIETMTVNEGINVLEKVRHDVKQLEEQRAKVEKDIAEDKLNKDLEAINTNLAQLKKLCKEWEALTKPALDKIKKELKQKIKEEKAKIGWDRMSNKTEKIIKSNGILSDLLLDYKIDMNHPLVFELKQEFQ